MAIVTDQDIPVTSFEDALNPPIGLRDQAFRTLARAITHPKLPANKQVQTYTKKESRPAQRSGWQYYNKLKSMYWRQDFKDCLNCWKAQPRTDAEQNECYSARSKHQTPPLTVKGRAPSTAFTQFMSDCLIYRVMNPGRKLPRCENLIIEPEFFIWCPGQVINFIDLNGVGATLISSDCGETTGAMQITAPGYYGDPNYECVVMFLDGEGRRGCATGSAGTEEQCCCIPAPPLFQLEYTTLQMQCEEQQSLGVNAELSGCPPYFWILMGGGSLDTGEGPDVVYTAPSSNEGCENNPTIGVVDACGTVRSVTLAVNCYTYQAPVCRVWSAVIGDQNVDGECQFSWECGAMCFIYNYRYEYYCNGSLANESAANYCAWPCSNSNFPYPHECVDACGKVLEATHGLFDGCPSNCILRNCGDIDDLRTPAQKLAGCCPLNPYTGLPF